MGQVGKSASLRLGRRLRLWLVKLEHERSFAHTLKPKDLTALGNKTTEDPANPLGKRMFSGLNRCCPVTVEEGNGHALTFTDIDFDFHINL